MQKFKCPGARSPGNFKSYKHYSHNKKLKIFYIFMTDITEWILSGNSQFYLQRSLVHFRSTILTMLIELTSQKGKTQQILQIQHLFQLISKFFCHPTTKAARFTNQIFLRFLLIALKRSFLSNTPDILNDKFERLFIFLNALQFAFQLQKLFGVLK